MKGSETTAPVTVDSEASLACPSLIFFNHLRVFISKPDPEPHKSAFQNAFTPFSEKNFSVCSEYFPTHSYHSVQ